jgi:DNA invertase Pin-like site-specific DNA recombinase
MQQERVLFLPATVPGGDGMIKSEIWHEIHSRFKLKETKKAIARTLGLSILTVRKVLRQATPRPYQRAKLGRQG